MAIASASNIGVHLGGRTLFGGVSFKLESGDRMTLSGRNGAGKSTLLRILAGEGSPDSGTLSYLKSARIALHDQRPPRDSDLSLSEYVLSGREEMIAAEAELARLERQMSATVTDDGDGSGAETVMRAYAETQARFEAAGGYLWRDQVQGVLRGLGFKPEQGDRHLSTFSGGELTRASLARALAAKPDLLLLDEPTNHLDIPTLEWLENYLIDLDAAIVLVAHDRWFLEAVGTSVLELEAGRARYFSGPWHAWRKEKAAREIAVGRQIEKQEAEIARMERFVERFRYKATKARQAQARVKQIEKVKQNAASHDPRDTRVLGFSFAQPERTARVAINAVGLRVEVPGRVLLDDAELVVERGEHIVLVGPNGAGKTTLMATIAGRREPAGGSVRLGHNVKIGYLSQHADTAAGEGTVLDAAMRETGLSTQKARALLGGFLFSGRDVDKKLSDISGGEQRRLSLAILVASGANVLLLDEPTNHLDVESREALEDALLGFEGVVVLVSHDRALLEAVGHRTVVCEGGQLQSFSVPWSVYQRERDERESGGNEVTGAQGAAGAGSAAAGNGGGRSGSKANGEAAGLSAKQANAKRRADRKATERAERRAARLERLIEKAEADLSSLEDELADPAAWSTPEKMEKATARHAAAKQKLEDLYAEWEAAASPSIASSP